MKLVVAAVSPTPILWRRGSGLASPTEVPASTLPARGTAPVRANIASNSVVLPLWKGPTSAMHRGPRGLLTSGPIAASSSGARPLIGSASRCSAYIGDLARRNNVGAVHRKQLLTSPRSLRGEVGASAKRKLRVRGKALCSSTLS